MVELIANSPVPGSQAAITTLAAAVTSTSVTSITVSGAVSAGLQGGQFRIVVDSEIMLVTAGQSGTGWTVVRGVEGSTAATHSNGVSVFHDLTAAGLQAVVNQAPFLPLAGGTLSGPVAMGSNKVTGLANGSVASDAAAFGQIPAAGGVAPNMDGTGAAGSAATWSRSDHVHPTDTSRAPLASPAFTGTPTAPTAGTGTNTTQLATTAFVLAQIAADLGVSLQPADTITSVAYAATVTPATPASGGKLQLTIGTLTAAITVANPTGSPVDGQEIEIWMVQDATGHAITWGANYAFGTDITSAMVPTTASAKFGIKFAYNATDSKWRCVGLVRGF